MKWLQDVSSRESWNNANEHTFMIGDDEQKERFKIQIKNRAESTLVIIVEQARLDTILVCNGG